MDPVQLRRRAMWELEAITTYATMKGVNPGWLPGLQSLSLALADVQRGSHNPMFIPARESTLDSNKKTGRGDRLEPAMRLSIAAASVNWLVKHKACLLSPKPAEEARKWVSDELRRRGVKIEPKAIDRHNRRFYGAQFRRAQCREDKHKPAIVVAKLMRDRTLDEMAQLHANLRKEFGLSNADAAWLVVERVLYRVAPAPQMSHSDRAENILRRAGLKELPSFGLVAAT
jgi:hypothetical protein